MYPVPVNTPGNKKPGFSGLFIARAFEQWINRALGHCENAVYCSIVLSCPRAFYFQSIGAFEQ
jgi:hypothetical protein